MKRHKRIETVVDDELEMDWRLNNDEGEQYDGNSQETFNTPAEFQDMWEGPNWQGQTPQINDLTRRMSSHFCP